MVNRFLCLFACASLMLAPIARAADQPTTRPAKEMNGLPLVFHEDFAEPQKAFARFELLDPGDWKMTKDGDRNVMALTSRPNNKTKTPFRSPFGRALIKDLYVGPFVMEVKLKSTIKPYPHQDLCLFFGVVDDAHEYYVHMGKKPDPHCGNFFIVDAADRKALAPVPEKGVDWTEQYHTARLVRGEDGATEIFFDGKSWLKMTNKTFPVGQVGIGSFDDTGDFAEVTVWGKKADKPAAPAHGTKTAAR